MPLRGAACGGVPARAGSRPAAGTADRDGHEPRSPSSKPSARPPARWPTGSRRGAGSSPHRGGLGRPWPPRSARQRCGRVRQTGSSPRSRCPHAPPARAPATTARRRPPILRGWSQNPHGRRVRQKRLDQIRRSVGHVLAVVENQQPDSAFQCGGHTVIQALPRLLGDAQHHPDRRPRPIRKLRRRKGTRRPGAPQPRSPGQAYRPRPPRSTSPTDEPSAPLGPRQFCFASDEARSLRAQVSRCRV
jgi:hypothetical protein